MGLLARLLSLVLFVALVGASVAQAAAGGMALEMALAGGQQTAMADCEGCPPDDGIAVSCDQLCTAPATALPRVEAADPAVNAGAHAVAVLTGPPGLTGPPEPRPPRTLPPI